jgi:soluble P-type ATPase
LAAERLPYTDKVKKAKEVIVDMTVQENNITFSTDAKLYKKVIEKCDALALKAVGLSFASAIDW